MSPTPAISLRPTSERRAAAARANGAKSRGPVTAQGKANSSRNSRKHGLRSRILFPDHRSDSIWIDALARYMHEFQPGAGLETHLVEALALIEFRQFFILRLEKTVLQDEMRRVQAVTPQETPIAALALAFRNLADHSCVLDRLNRVDRSLYERLMRTLQRLCDIRARRSHFLQKYKMNERTREAAENKGPHLGATPKTAVAGHAFASSAFNNAEKVNMNERTRQIVETKERPSAQPAQPPLPRAAAANPFSSVFIRG